MYKSNRYFSIMLNDNYIYTMRNFVHWDSDPDEMHVLHTKVDLASRFSQSPSVPTWHTSPSTMNCAAQGLGFSSRGFFLCNPDILISLLFSLPLFSFSLSMCMHTLFFPFSFCSLLSSSPWRLPWSCSLGPVNLPESSFPINPPLYMLI